MTTSDRAMLKLTCLSAFAQRLTSNEWRAIDEAQAVANATSTPCGVWQRGGWYTVCDVAPELIEPDPTLTGWVLWAVVDPMGSTS